MHKINFCNSLSFITVLCCITALVMYNTVAVAEAETRKFYLTDADQGKDIQATTIVILIFSLLIIINDTVMCDVIPGKTGKLVKNILNILFCIAIVIASSLNISRLQDIDTHQVEYNETQVTAMKAMSYISGSLGLVTVIGCGLSSLKKIMTGKE